MSSQPHFPSSNALRSVPFQVKRFSGTDWFFREMSVVSHLVLSFSDRYSLWRFCGSVVEGHFPHLQKLEMTARDDVIIETSPGERARYFTQLASQCPRLEWLDVDLRACWYDDDDDNDDPDPLKIDWPEERQTLHIVYHHHQPEGGGVGWLEPWRFFRGNVRVVDDPEEIRESKKKAEAQWIVSPYQSP